GSGGAPAEPPAPARGAAEPGEQGERGRLAAPRLADDRPRLSAGDAQAHAAQHLDRARRRRERLVDAVHLEDQGRAFSASSGRSAASTLRATISVPRALGWMPSA